MLRQKFAGSLLKTSRAGFVVLERDVMKDKGKGDEQVYMKKQDEKIMKELLEKMENQCDDMYGDGDDPTHTLSEKDAQKKIVDYKAKHMTSLLDILHKHGIKENDKIKDELFAWKQEY